MAGRDPRSARLLGLWTAGWLAVLLVAGLIWLGDLSLQWPVLHVPELRALVALRPRRRHRYPDEFGPEDDLDEDEDDWHPVPAPDRSTWRPAAGYRTDTVERSAVEGRAQDGSGEEGSRGYRSRDERY